MSVTDVDRSRKLTSQSLEAMRGVGGYIQSVYSLGHLTTVVYGACNMYNTVQCVHINFTIV